MGRRSQFCTGVRREESVAVQLTVAGQTVKRRLGGWCEMADSLRFGHL
jgi:hypothetical protein